MPLLSPTRLQTPSLTFQVAAEGTLHLFDNQTGARHLIVPSLELFVPVIDGQRCALQFARLEKIGEHVLTIHFTSERLAHFTVRIEALPGEDAFDISSSFQTHQTGQLNRLEFFPPETTLHFNNLVNYRNRHFTEGTWPELLVDSDQGFKTDTYSTDWQFAPHPTMFIFRKQDLQLFFGAFDLPKAFGMYLDVAKRQTKSWYLDYGQTPNGEKLDQDQTWSSPRFRLFARRGKTVEGMLDVFASMLIRAGQIPDPTTKVRAAWWREPLYCTWIDQCYLGDAKVPADLKEQTLAGAQTQGAGEARTDSMVRRAAAIIEQEKLPFRTVLIDAGWATTGLWMPLPERFPNFRKLVDDLHAQGLKVVVWWNWAEIANGAPIPAAELAAGGKPNRHGQRVRDYSHPAAQEHLKKLFHHLFSSDPGCCDLDGVKTDFLADKVHPDIPLANPAWRGEENYFLQVTKLFYGELKRHKPDGIHIGCAGNFWLAHYIDINRTYDNSGINYLQHETRGLMLRHTTPGCPVAYDFHNFLENLDRYLALAHTHEASVQIGNILFVQHDPISKVVTPHADYYALLRNQLPFQKLP